MMLRCTFCNKVFQGSQFQATRHFTQTNYCKDVSDEALYEIARRSQQKFESDQMERVARYAAERGVDVPDTGGVRGGEAGRQPVEGASGGVGGDGGGGDTEEGVIDVDREARIPSEQGVPGHEDMPEVYPGTGERMEDFLRRAAKETVGEGSSKRKEGGTDPAAAPAGKRHHQQKVTDVYDGEWVAHHKKTFLRWLYSSGVPFNAFRNQAWKAYQQVLLEQPGSSPRAVLPSDSEIASMQAVQTYREELAEELEEVRLPFWITDATLLSDGRKSRDGRPIVNFLVAGLRGVVVYTTINREGEPDDAVHVLRRWVTIFHEFSAAARSGSMRYAQTPHRHIDLDSTRRVTEHTARLQPGLGPRDRRMTAAREVAASGCEPQRGCDRGVSDDSLEYALMAATRAVHEQTPRKHGVPPRPRPVPAEGGDALGETSGAEGLGMPRGSRREQTVTEASARVVVLRKAGAAVTIEEDAPETDVTVREEDEDYEGEEEGEEESERGSNGDYDHDEHEPPPPPPKGAARRRAAQTPSSS
ncbi:hypothetical protein CBR_g51908 [Chara braunii]|uniref:DUF659 domain-containing protein n=1 Tax=Chara braunii TaxID=69332 RepID=A0A388M942_CHABU|nr:hypothetical protein CBR_g51908 [Chara braunii]|eukprot:GBG91104.1 hypothetical protein CBR_g51908 [Chara braunii]